LDQQEGSLMSDDFLSVSHSVEGVPGDLILQLVVGAPGPVRVDWGDSTLVETVAASSSTPHTYSKAGSYRVNVTGHSGLHQSFGVVMGSPMPAWDATTVAENVQGPIEDAAAIAATTGRLG
jgi:hypothetical protein